VISLVSTVLSFLAGDRPEVRVMVQGGPDQ
jgi:hypothetical protein